MWEGFVISDIALYLIGVLALLMIWQYHQIQVLSGRIYAVDFWDVSGIRMLIHVAASDDQTCSACQEAHGTVFLPSLATKKGFSTLEAPCSNGDGCRCLVVGLYAGWSEGNRLVHYLRKNGKKMAVKLDDSQLQELFKETGKETLSSAGDRLSIKMIQGMNTDLGNPGVAINYYYDVIKNASGARDLRLVVPAYLRLAERLEQANRLNEAIDVIREFETRFSRKKTVFYYPTGEQRWMMATRKSRLLKKNKDLNELNPASSPSAPVHA